MIYDWIHWYVNEYLWVLVHIGHYNRSTGGINEIIRWKCHWSDQVSHRFDLYRLNVSRKLLSYFSFFYCVLTGIFCLLLFRVALFILSVRFNGGCLGGDGKPTRILWPNLITDSRSENTYYADRWWIWNYNSFPKLCFIFFCGADVETFRSSVHSSSFVLRLRHPPARSTYIHSPASYNIFTRPIYIT